MIGLELTSHELGEYLFAIRKCAEDPGSRGLLAGVQFSHDVFHTPLGTDHREV